MTSPSQKEWLPAHTFYHLLGIKQIIHDGCMAICMMYGYTLDVWLHIRCMLDVWLHDICMVTH